MNLTTGQLREPSSPQPRRSGVVGMVLAGVASGCLLVWFTGDRFFNSEASESAIVVQHTLLVCAIAGALWVTRQRAWRAFASSLFLFWAFILVLVALPWDDPEGAGSPGGSSSLPVATEAS